MNFQLPNTTTTSSASTGFSFGLQNTNATATASKPTFTFLSNAGGGSDANASKLPTFGMSNSKAPTSSIATNAGATAPTGLSGFISTPATAAATTNAVNLAAPTTNNSVTKTTGAPIMGINSLANTNTANSGFANLSTATKTTDSNAVTHTTQLTYNQLEDHINKWTLEFEELEKIFIEQATQINAWDKILINNNHKILELNNAVQKVKSDQQILEQELEFISTQHKELEESILPLQKEFTNLPQVDVERSQTYMLVENLDTQLKQMSEDLKEIIDNLNESNKNIDTNDPIIQIGKILNAHMSSLQWIESSSTHICNKLDDINKMHELQKRDAHRSAFYSS